MRLTEVFVFAILGCVCVSTLTAPHGCSGFSSILTKKRAVNPVLKYPGLVSRATSNVRKRFLLNDLNTATAQHNYRKMVIDAVTSKLPASKEIHSSCRIAIDTTSQQDIEFIKVMLQHHYRICKICDGVQDDCTTVGFCPSNSVCYKGHSDDSNTVQHTTHMNISMWNYLHPKAYTHGCCDPLTTSCRSGTHMVSTTTKTNYTIKICNNEIACNSENPEKDIFITKIIPTPVNGHWSLWSHWSHCSVTCGHGTMVRNRTCTNPAPSGGGHICAGSSYSTANCSLGDCHVLQVNGHWSQWGQWSDCSVSCGGGTMVKTRSCTNPAPSGGGHDCIGSSTTTYTCSLDPCPVNGHWSQWGHWSDCPVTCGGGTMVRTRTCSNPAPTAGGHDCSGLSSMTFACSTDQCAVDGQWSQWDEWSHCSVTCGGGTFGRSRTCTNPAPSGGGHDCSGSSSLIFKCNTADCPIEGQWAQWGEWSHCSVTCGGGTFGRSRTCTNPPPSGGGHYCSGSSNVTYACNTAGCPIEGQWSDWSDWSHCSVTCGSGTSGRTRTCTNPPPSNGGHLCPGSSSETTNCKMNDCIVDGQWSPWGQWSHCSVSCNGGTMNRNRICNNPAPIGGGQDCVGVSSETSTCATDMCPEWSSWLNDSCSVSCGNGTMMRTRHCSSGQDAECLGPATEAVVCNTFHCPENGGWGTWSTWSSCSVTCGDGLQARTRSCDSPVPQYGGRNCQGSMYDTFHCKGMDCP